MQHDCIKDTATTKNEFGLKIAIDPSILCCKVEGDLDSNDVLPSSDEHFGNCQEKNVQPNDHDSNDVLPSSDKKNNLSIPAARSWYSGNCQETNIQPNLYTLKQQGGCFYKNQMSMSEKSAASSRKRERKKDGCSTDSKEVSCDHIPSVCNEELKEIV